MRLNTYHMDLFSSLTTIILLATCQSDNGHASTWHCIDNKCIKNESEYANRSDFRLAHDYCKLTCGPYGSLWPRPTGKTKLSSDIVPIHPSDIFIDIEGVTDDREIRTTKKLIEDMGSVFVKNIWELCKDNCSRELETALTIRISTTSAQSDITWDTDESYTLDVKTDGLKITANIVATTVFGARNGLETLYQTMVSVSKNDHQYAVMMIDTTYVVDRPVYPHRGLLIDTSRHFLKTNTIRKTIDGMSHSKLNVLHWHATDSHSFPIIIPQVPQLSNYGAYSPDEVYTLDEISRIISYAKIRGVRVIIEIDSPAHAGNGWQWGPSAGLGDLAVCVNSRPYRNFCGQPPCGQLNPVNENTYKILGRVYENLLAVLPKGEVFHMGGDEVSFPCWNSSTEITDYMKNHNISDNQEGFLKLWSYFHHKSMKMLDNVVGNDKTIIILWSSDLTAPKNIEKYLDKNRFVIQTWVGANAPLIDQLLDKGYKMIVSTENAWYLDHGFREQTIYRDWKTVYANRLPPKERGVYGGEVCAWGELIDDAALDSRAWPKAAAAAERMWSNPTDSSSDALYRFLYHRQRLVRLGIRADAVSTEWCTWNDDVESCANA